jgi:hypothetical protein
VNGFVIKLQALEKQVAAEKGPFQLFAILLREDAPNKWDLVVAAPWLEQSHREGLKFLSRRVIEALSKDELLMLSGIIIVESDNPGVKAIRKAFPVEHGNFEIGNNTLFDMPIKQGHIVTSGHMPPSQLKGS